MALSQCVWETYVPLFLKSLVRALSSLGLGLRVWQLLVSATAVPRLTSRPGTSSSCSARTAMEVRPRGSRRHWQCALEELLAPPFALSGPTIAS
eukprot:3134255-Rhodomonas_salina.2